MAVHFGCRSVDVPGPDGGNFCLHTHPYFKSLDLFNTGSPTRLLFADRDVREEDDLCRHSVEIACFSVPWFKHFEKEWIEKYAAVIRKVIENHKDLLASDAEGAQGGRWYGMENE